MKATDPIGIFDSGVGGLSVLRHIWQTSPYEQLIYFADQAHVPYGSRSLAEIKQFSAGITRFLLNQGAKIIVVACNTATAAALKSLRSTFPEIPFVGMEPAVKPAALTTQSGKVGVLATANTFASPRYANLMYRFAQDVVVLEDPCHGLVPLIEAGHYNRRETKQLLRTVLVPMLNQGIDTLVLGCTHYPFVRPLIEQIIGEEGSERTVTIIDPAPAVARQTRQMLAEQDLLAPTTQQGTIQLLTSADPELLIRLGEQLLGHRFPAAQVFWHDAILSSA